MAHGKQKINIPPLQYLTKPHVEQIKNGPRSLSKIRQMMKRIKDFGSEQNIWVMGSWNGEGITKLWSTIGRMLDTYLSTEINSNTICCTEKSRKGQICWRICYNNMQKQLPEDNRVCQRR